MARVEGLREYRWRDGRLMPVAEPRPAEVPGWRPAPAIIPPGALPPEPEAVTRDREVREGRVLA